MKNLYHFIRPSYFYKNLLIFLPIIVSNNLILFLDYSKIITASIIFFLITNLCYLINDYTDRHIDKLNKLKKRTKKLNFKNIYKYIFFYLLIIGGVIIFFDQQKNYYIYLYLINFLLYNFYFKKKKYLDLIFLTNFYLIRVFYGCQLFDLRISFGFIIFLFLFFFSFGVYKRIIQISVNKIKSDNKIISYSNKDNNFLKKIIYNLIFLNFIIFQLYIALNLKIFKADYLMYFYQDFNLYSLLFLDLIYVFFIFRIIYTLSKNLIKDDVYIFFIKDKITLVLIILGISIFFYEFFI